MYLHSRSGVVAVSKLGISIMPILSKMTGLPYLSTPWYPWIKHFLTASSSG